MINPDKHIRAYFFNALEGLNVNGVDVKLHDFFNPDGGEAFILMTSASKDENLSTKCGLEWECKLLFDIVTQYPNIEVKRQRILADDIQEEILNRTKNIKIENFEVVNVERSYPDDLFLTTSTKQIFRKFIRFNIKLK